ncbi:MAG: glycosyl hydrolase family 28-related protein [Bryobacteraceae bacterium]
MISRYGLPGFCVGWAISWGLAAAPQAAAQVPATGFVSVKDFGANGDGVTDDRAAIQAAIDSVTAGAVYLPPTARAYLITPTPDKKTFLTLKANVQLIGIGNPLIRIAASSAPYDAVISASSCDNCAIQNLTIDSNIDGNPIENKSGLYAHPRFEILLGSGHRIRIEHVTIQNSSSMNSIVSGVPISDITISHCIFSGNGDDPNHVPHDHSALYIHADGAVIDGNIFTAVRRDAPAAVTAIETHGSGILVTGNIITNYSQGMNVTGSAPSDSVGNVVSGNTIRGTLNGITIWSHTDRGHLTGYGENGLLIAGNTIIVNHTSYAGSPGTAMATSGIAVDPHSDLPFANVIISGNTVIFDREDSLRPANSASIGIGWWSTSGQMAENLMIVNNIIDNAPVAGIRLAAALKGCRVQGNIIRNAGSSLDTAIAANYKTPIFIAGAPSIDVEVVDNQLIDSLEPSRMRTALFLATSKGISSGVQVRNNSVSIPAANKASFTSYVQIEDDSTKPLLVATWDDFVAPTQKVAAGSEDIDSKSGATWRAGSDGIMLRQR